MASASASFVGAAVAQLQSPGPKTPLKARYGTIQRVLIANRGEIAVRIIKTCRSMGLTSIAVFSEADENALYVKLADEATCIGPAPSLQSYLSMDNVLSACHRMQADAVHPGYGFLSENGDFSDRCASEGIIFIGPDGLTMNTLGNKLAVKQRLQKDSPETPLIPGYNGRDQSSKRLASEAKRMGFPVLLKAAAGGGGKGMRVVHRVEELEDAISAVKSEALNGFGNDQLLVEKYFGSCRHIEFQIFGDHFGNVIHFGERDCSLQRRHQKVIEESPSPFMTPDLRRRMGATAVQIGKLCNYVGAGTVEFLVDETRKFYFLEVNTRLQVEHPVTELIQGLDFVALQIQIAQGKRLDTDLGVTPDRHKPHPTIRHAMECRIYAEDPTNNFFPCTGQLLRWTPFLAQGLRYDSGVVSGSVIGIYYDPMIAKVIAFGSSREEVLQRMVRALQQSVILGMVTNKAFLLALLTDPNFVAGRFDTRYLDTVYTAERRMEIQRRQLASVQLLQDLAVGAWLWEWQVRSHRRRLLRHIPAGFSNGGLRWTEMKFRLKSRTGTAEQEPLNPEVRLRYRPVRQYSRFRPGHPQDPPKFEVQFLENDLGSKDHCEQDYGPTFHVGLLSDGSGVDGLLEFTLNDVRCRLHVASAQPDLGEEKFASSSKAGSGAEIWVGSPIHGEHVLLRLPRLALPDPDAELLSQGVHLVRAPMPCKVLRVVAGQVGETVKKGDVLLVLESMKMELKIHADLDGVVKTVACQPNDVVEEGASLLQISLE